MSEPLYFIERDLGKLGTAFVETQRNVSRARLVADIAQGQHENIITVLEVIEDEGTCRDISEDIAHEVAHALDARGNGCPAHLVDFIDGHLGVLASHKIDWRAGVLEPERV